MDFQALPEGCIAHILSYIDIPVDLCRLSLVCRHFYSLAQSDDIWDRFLPSDLVSIISRSHSESLSSLLATTSSKKALYLTLSDHPIIIDQGTKSFQLDKRTGKKCYMVSAKNLWICWAETPQHWNWATLPESRFQQVAMHRAVCWFAIHGAISTLELSSNTHYAAYLVFNMIDPDGFHHSPVELSLGIREGPRSTKNVCLDPYLEESQLDDRFQGLQRPNVRNDGLLEIEMGEFFNSGIGDEVDIRVYEIQSHMWKHGFLLEGIEARPKMPGGT